MAKPVRWSGVGEAGFVSGMRLLFWLYRHSYTLLRIVMVPVVFYYFMTNSNARRSSRDYLRRLQASDKLGAAPSPSSWNVYRHLSSFARASLDKLGIWADPQRFGHIEFVNRQLLLEQMDSGQGAILMGAHLGNMEICRQMSQKTKRLKLNVLVHTRHAGMFNRLLRELDIHHELELIEVSELTPATAIRLSECIDRGEFIAILADRIPVASEGRWQPADFLGSPAYFPEGPFILAALLKCPVYTLFCVREDDSYVVRCDRFADKILLPRKDRPAALAHYIQEFASILEENLRKTPMQWFNFYPFWEKPE